MKFYLIVLLLPVVAVLSSCSLLNTNTSDSEADEIQTPEMTVSDTTGSPVVRDTATQHRRLPTLREQMQRIEEHQAIMQEDIGFIKNDLAVLKEEVVQLRNTLTSGKPAVTETEAVKGPSTVRPKTEATTKDEEPVTATVLLADEDIAPKEEVPKEEVPKKKPTKPQGVVPRQEQKPVSMSIPSDEQAKAAETVKQPVAKESAPVVPSDLYKDAMQYVAKKEYDKATPLLEDVLKNDKNPVTRGNALYWLGEGAYASGDYEKAIEHFKSTFAIKSSTKADDALLMMAEAYRKMGKTDEARKMYNKLIDTYPQSEFVARARKMLQML